MGAARRWRAARGGSSPLARGLRATAAHAPATPRIIPARAGFTSPGSRVMRPPRDHPRSRGVYSRRRVVPIPVCGSSSLARGLRHIVLPPDITLGIIPARAGFTLGPAGGADRWEDHPRSRGVYVPPVGHRGAADGSSPLARGLPVCSGGIGGVVGIIPARAGFTVDRGTERERDRDHPRSRGVYRPTASGLPREAGSSPLARGLLVPVAAGLMGTGIIPARAGFTT